jgi:hypothetical protein
MRIKRQLRPFRGIDRWVYPRRVVWFVAVGADGNVAGATTAEAAALALRRQHADPDERRAWREAFDDEERAAITASARR